MPFKKVLKYGYLTTLKGGAILFKFALTVVLARYAGLEVLGQYGLIAGLTIGIPVLTRSGIFISLTRELIDESAEKISCDLTHYVVWIIGCYLLLMLPAVLIGEIVSPSTPSWLWIAITFVTFAEHLAADIIVILNNLRRQVAANIFGLIQAAITTLPIIFVGLFNPEMLRIESIVFLWLCGLILSLTFTCIYYRSLINFHLSILSRHWYKPRLKRSFNLFINDLISILCQISDRYIVAILFNIELTGIYIFFIQFSNSIFTLVNSSVIQAFRPQIISNYKRKDFSEAKTLLRKMSKESTVFTIIIGVAIGLLMPILVSILNKPIMLNYIKLYWCLLIALVMRVNYMAVTINIFSLSKDILLIQLNIIGLVVLIGTSFALKSFVGIYAMPIALFLCFAICWLYGTHSSKI
jgi:O-antigen/teichoic acid export membrane protein